MRGPCSEKFAGAYPQDQNERPSDRVLFSFLVIQFYSRFLYTLVYSSACFRLVCFEMFPLFLLRRHKIFGTRVGALKREGPCMAEHVRTFLNAALSSSDFLLVSD